jgi:hypothetical protein
VAGAAVVAVYAASAALSGHLSPLARRPLLDGLIPPIAYRWVDPPRALAAENEPPTEQRFELRLTPVGSETAVFTTDDAQVSLILARRSFPSEPGQRSVDLLVEPLAPSAVEPPELPLRILGNVYRLSAIYQPSGDPAPLEIEIRVVLSYPLILGDHGGHELIVSRRGRTWRPVETNDLASILQADGPIEELGYLAVAATRAPSPTPGAEAQDGGNSPIPTILIAAALAVLAGGTVILLRPRGPSRPAAGGGRGSRRGSSRY